MAKFSEECCLVKKGLDAEFHKCFKEGKSIIVEGIHVNPQIYSEMVLESRKHISESILEGKIPSRGCLRLLFCVFEWVLYSIGLLDNDLAAVSEEVAAMDTLPKTTPIKRIVVSFLLTLEDEKAHREIVTGWVRSNDKLALQVSHFFLPFFFLFFSHELVSWSLTTHSLQCCRGVGPLRRSRWRTVSQIFG